MSRVLVPLVIFFSMCASNYESECKIIALIRKFNGTAVAAIEIHLKSTECPKKCPIFTLIVELLGQEFQCRYFWNVETCSDLAG